MFEYMIYDPGRLPQWPTKSRESASLQDLLTFLWGDLDYTRSRGRFQVGIQVTNPQGRHILQGTRVDIDDAIRSVTQLRTMNGIPA